MTESASADRFHDRLQAVLARELDGFVALKQAERLSGGASQETYRLLVDTRDGERLLALRRSAGGELQGEDHPGPGIDVEARLMQLARRAGIPEPEVYAVLEPSDGLGNGFVMQWLEGETLGARIAHSERFESVRPRLARQTGEILARIHAVDLEASGLREVLETRTAEDLVRLTWERYQEFGTPQPMIDYAARWLLDHLPDSRQETLVHADFRNGNLMITPEDGIVAVLDWEGAHIGAPMKDVGYLCTNSWRFGRTDLPVGGFGRIADFVAGYESVSGRPVDMDEVKFWTVYGSFWWAVGCLGMAEQYRSGPDRTVERPGIGRRSSECQVDCVNLLIPGPVSLVQAADAPPSTVDMPRTDELIGSVRDFLRGDVMGETRGRTNFLARVASNSLDIVLRELELGPQARARELANLRSLLGIEGDVETLRWALVRALRDGSMPLDRPGLADYLRDATTNQLAIDQPKYSGLATALDPERRDAMA